MPLLRQYRKNLTQSRLHKLFNYNKASGVFTRRIKMRQYKIGSKAGTVGTDGYIMIMVDGILYRAHRLAFLYVKGQFPSIDVDHKNKIRNDNSWDNLREATFSQNRFNALQRSDNKSGYVGVSIFRNKFQASIVLSGKRFYLGTFKTAVEAAKTYNEKAKELYGEFHNT